MKILITGADVEQHDGEFQVIYDGSVVYTDSIHACCVCVALDQQRLDQLVSEASVPREATQLT